MEKFTYSSSLISSSNVLIEFEKCFIQRNIRETSKIKTSTSGVKVQRTAASLSFSLFPFSVEHGFY